MKHLYISYFFFLLYTTIQAQFGEAHYISLPSDTSSGEQYIRTADIDLDGKSDIIVASSFNNVIRYFHNEGDFSFAEPVLIPGSWVDLRAMETADINDDGAADVVSLDKQDGKLFWHPNVDGDLDQQVLIAENLELTSGRILCHDFNGDGSVDIVIVGLFNLHFFANEGDGNFSAPQNILAAADEEEIYDNVMGDYNNDGFMDLAISVGGFNILLNDGAGNFSENPGGGIGFSFLLESADYNNDGFDDMLMAANTLEHYQNSPTGFSIVGTFTPNNEHYETIFSSDLDNDGDLDVISEDDQTNAFFWYENEMGGSSWVRHTISIGFNGSSIFGVRAEDLDGDGDQDLIRSSSNGDVAIYENQLILSLDELVKVGFKMFPNPASDEVSILSTTTQIIDLELYDMLGKLILERKDLSTLLPLNVSELNSGNYFVKLIGDKTMEMKKLVVIH